MGQEDLAKNPPKTEVLSVEEKQLTPEELLELGSGKVETEEVPVETKPKTIKTEETEEEVTPELTEEEIEQEPEITHDPLKDTQAELTRTKQEVAKLKKIVTAAVAKEEFREPPTAQQMFNLPDRPIMPKPEEMDDGITYAQKIAKTLEQQQAYDHIVSDYESFVAEHPDWLDLQSTMQKISRRFPELMYGRRAMHKIYDLAVLYDESAARQQARDEELAEAQKTGANIEREKVKATGTFVKPGAGAVRTKPTIPDFSNMDMPEIEKWLKDNRAKAIQLGLIKE